MLLMIDNYDSFTYNVVQYLAELGADVVVHRNDEITLAEIETLDPEFIVISPGPCTPNEAGISMDVVRTFGGHIPLLGVCLGHQCIGAVFGGDVIRARQVMHGKTSMIHHTDARRLRRAADAVRSNPLSFADRRSASTLPDCLEMTAWTQHEDGTVDEIMGVRHRTLPIEGVQFHPESILTRCGHDLLRNFLRHIGSA